MITSSALDFARGQDRNASRGEENNSAWQRLSLNGRGKHMVLKLAIFFFFFFNTMASKHMKM